MTPASDRRVRLVTVAVGVAGFAAAGTAAAQDISVNFGQGPGLIARDPDGSAALPFKLIFFVLVDGWSLVAGSLIQSYGA